MADIRGPYKNLTADSTLRIDTVEANESVPALFYCTFTCQDYTIDYNFRLYIDIVYDPSLLNRDPKRNFISLEFEGLHEKNHFNITTTPISSCNLMNNESTYEIQIDLSIDQETPATLISKCAVRYSSNLCFGFDTFVIIPSVVDPAFPTTHEEPTSTSIEPTSTSIEPTSTSMEPTSTSMEPNSTIVEPNSTSIIQNPQPTVTVSPNVQNPSLCLQGCISGIGVLGVLLATETAILIFLICCLFKKSKKIKPQDTSDEVVITNHKIKSNANGADRSIKAICVPMKTYNPHLVPDDDSAMGTVSTLTISDSVGDMNNLNAESDK